MEEFEISTISRKTKPVYISTVISIALVLLMAGLLGLILVHARNLSNHIKENIVLNIILDEETDEKAALKLQEELNENDHVLSTHYISKELAARNLQQDLGEDFLEFLGYNPLSGSIDVHLKAEYAQQDSIQNFITATSKSKEINEIIYQESLLDLVNKNIRIIGLVILAFATILLIIAVALINNTIRLSIYSQRFLIKSMQMVGATKGFIRKPFLGYGILHGLLGSVIAIILLILLLYLGQQQIPELILLENYFEFALIFIGVILVGILISGFSTYFAVSKYLRLRMTDLYR